MKIVKFFSILFLAGVFLSSCHKDREESELVDIIIPSPEIVYLFNGDLQVYVTDLAGNAMEGVQVFVYNEKAETNKWGIAEFKDIPLDKNGTYVRALANDYFFGSDKFYPIGENNFTTIRMLPIENGKNFNPNAAVSIEVNGGGQIKFQPNSVLDGNGNIYNEEVTVYAHRLNTNDQNFEEIMPGTLLAVDKDNKTVVLGTYGMIAVELRDADNNELNLNPDLPATVHFPVTPELLSIAPSVIPLWSFDEQKGLWKEEGSADLIGNEYVGTVSHFSFWNCDAPFDVVNIEGRVLQNDGTPFVNALIKIKAGALTGTGYTNSAGSFGGKIPKDEDLTIEIYALGCMDLLYEAAIGPFSDNVVLDDIILDTQLGIASGNVTCSGTGYSEALIIVQFPNKSYQFSPEDDGSFNLNIAELICEENVGVIFAFDPETNLASPAMSISSSNASGFVMDVCSSCDFTYNFDVNVIDICTNTTSVNLSVSNGSGEYYYEWSNGGTSEEVLIQSSQLLCVTITDIVAECDATFCEDITLDENLSVSVNINDGDCTDEAQLDANVSGGTSPYTFNWFGPNGFTSADQNIVVTEEGIYELTVTDANDCSVTLNNTISFSSGTYVLDIIASSYALCEGEEVVLEAFCNCGGLFFDDIQWLLPDGSTEFGPSIITSMPGYYLVEAFEGTCSAVGDFVLTLEIAPDLVVEMVCDSQNELIYADITNLPDIIDDPNFYLTDSLLIVTFQSVYDGTFTVFDNVTGCSFDIPYTIPYYFNGLVIDEVIEASCIDCEDGYAVISDLAGVCYDCEYDTYYIYKADDFYTDYRIQNENNNLGAGIYYLVAKSTEGCIVFSTSFEI